MKQRQRTFASRNLWKWMLSLCLSIFVYCHGYSNPTNTTGVTSNSVAARVNSTTNNQSLKNSTSRELDEKKLNNIANNLMSGFVGALIVTVLNWLVGFFRRKREYYSLLKAVKSECEFNLSIMDEIARGIAQGVTGSYKRVKSDFYLELRKISYKYYFNKEFYSCMARVSCDEDVLNSELDALQITSQNGGVNNVLLRKTALCAVVGVKGSLSDLKAKVEVLTNQLPWSLFFR